MKITLEVDVVLRDWMKARKISLKEHVATIEDGATGKKFSVTRVVGGLTVMVSQEGTHREAVANINDLVQAMADALVEHGKEIDAEAA